MDFDSLIMEAQPQSACSQLFVHYPARHPVWSIVQSVEEAGGEIIGVEVAESDRSGYKIGLMRLTNHSVQDIVIILNEGGVLGVQGIGRRIPA